MRNIASISIYNPEKKMKKHKLIRKNIPLWLMMAPILIYFIVFKYIPMGGLVLAFKNYKIADGILGSSWVGLNNYKILFSGVRTVQIIWNTFYISVLSIFVSFPFPILIAILLNEVKKEWFKKGVQTAVYLPHFFSWVVVSGIVIGAFSQQTGVVNSIVKCFGGEPYAFMYNDASWLTIFVGAGIWKEAGFKSIIYLAALTNIDPQLYEASSLDGANKWQKIWNITLPAIAPTISIMLILAMGGVMEVGFEQIFTLQNNAVSKTSDVISTYIYRMGIQNGQFSLTTAMGLFESFVGLVLVMISNRIAKRFEQSLW